MLLSRLYGLNMMLKGITLAPTVALLTRRAMRLSGVGVTPGRMK